MAHSKRNTSLAFFTAHERSLLQSSWGSQATRLSRDSFLPFASCQLCLQVARDPVSCASHGDIFCRECAVNNLLAQGKEIKRLKKEDQRRQKEVQENEIDKAAEEKQRAILEFEKTMMGLEGGAKKPRRDSGTTTGNGDELERPEGRGVKRKFELDEAEMLKNAKAERVRARQALDDEEAAKPTLPSFWVPSLTPSTNNSADTKQPKLSPLCPASSIEKKHPLSLKSLITINFNKPPNSKSTTESPTFICPACDKNLNNTIKAIMTVPCGHVLCKPCASKFMSPDQGPPDPHASPRQQAERSQIICYVCETNLSRHRHRDESDKACSQAEKGPKPGLVELKCEGTGFAGAGNNMVQRKDVAFQC